MSLVFLGIFVGVLIWSPADDKMVTGEIEIQSEIVEDTDFSVKVLQKMNRKPAGK